ncbi:MAG TPA: PSD1 and planctomycete cytochrome C domain-containing protein [Bryobacteraceae bacterium]|jgi:mono/diheme cytochrome c family protein
MNATRVIGFGLVWCVGLGMAQSANPPQPKSDKVDFVRDIQPIFQKSCVMCHGPQTQMAGLRLDAKESVFAKVVVPGKPAESHLYQRVAGIGDVARMPMGGRLADDQIATIKAWIDQGAEWPDGVGAQVKAAKTHWAFIPPKRPPLPSVKDTAWPRNPIDYFILARLEKEGLSPSPEADRTTLLRRLSLDLTGLPPTPAEVDDFLKDKRKDAYEVQVDRLLNSPHYGERWARFWLDAAQYADSNGYEKDRPREVWPYRDWVIDALNRNLPYNQFVTDQIAGDLIPNHTAGDVVATGFLRNSLINEEGGVDPEQFRMEANFDRMHVIGSAILGLTVQCAQCHNHKFDPLKQEEYYRMMAFINQTHEADIAVYSPEQEMKRTEILRRQREIEGTLQRHTPDWKRRMAEWENSVRVNQPEWTLVKLVVDDISTGGERYLPMKDDSFLELGYAPTHHKVKLTLKTEMRNISAIRLELLTDPELPRGGPGRSQYGVCAISEFEVEAAPVSDPSKVTKVKFSRATADINLPETPLAVSDPQKEKKHRIAGPIEFAVDGKDETAWTIDAGPGLRNQPRQAVFDLDTPIDNAGGTLLTFYIAQDNAGENSDKDDNNNIGKMRLALTSAANAVADPLPAGVRTILSIPVENRSPEQTAAVFAYWRTTVPQWKKANDEIAALWKEYPEGASQLVFEARDEPRETHVLTRGDFLKPAKVVDPGTPAYLNPLPAGAPVNRLTFAKWMTDRSAPTTARALVNRFWQAYFGIGIVATSEDLGTQCDPPSHPELLDWLAVEFMDRGWDQKAIHRLIVTSSAYRQSSNITPELREKDPYNRLIARGPRLRMEAESVRDIALEASGLLNPKIGGPSVFPPAPAFLFLPPVSYAAKIWPESTGPDRYRRGLYTFRYRSVPNPMMETFDAPNGDSSCVRRGRSDTPLQALTTLNEPLFVETARALALKTLREGGRSEDQRITYAFRRCVSRRPDEQEATELRDLLRKEIARYSEGKRNPWDLAADDPAHPPHVPKDVTPAEAAAWTVVARVILNLDETITKE